MTDPKTRSPEYWQAFGWVCAVSATIVTVGGIGGIVLGSWTGWIAIGLALLLAIQSIGYFQQYRRGRREREFGARRD
ncbi:hypothetical protein AB4Z18_08555 [Leifsonia sp. 2TAF2]|uniref:hypothetical protein n=1 Tax=Leifsonia sp. 2TAF2 TaxID=3233009 RepID=UPI003F9B9008